MDVSTGEFRATEFAGDAAEDRLRDELQLLRPREILLPRQAALFPRAAATRPESLTPGPREGVETRLEEWIFRSEFGERILTRAVWSEGPRRFWPQRAHPRPSARPARCSHYLRETSAKTEGETPSALLHLDSIRYYEQQDALMLDPVTVRNLELVAPLYGDDAPRGAAAPLASLLGAIDKTVTCMGARLLRAWVLRPEIDAPKLARGSMLSAELKSHTMLREEIRQNLRGVQDLERLASRATLGVATPRDLSALRHSLARIPAAAPLPRELRGGAAHRAARRNGRARRRPAAPRGNHRRGSARARLRSRRHSRADATPSSTNCATSASTAGRSSPPWKSANANAPASAR